MKTSTDWKKIPIPDFMKRLPVDHRGYPVPFIVFRDKEDKPHFRINDTTKVLQCVKEDRCSICGNTLGSNKWIVGGPLSAFHPHGAFNDIPVHRECCEYALQVCPYMAFSQYKGIGITDNMITVAKDNQVLLLDPAQDLDRLPLFVMCKISDFEFVVKNHQGNYVIPKKPYLEVHYWNDGVELPEKEAIEIMHNYSK